jgi:hypothetical protein
MAGFRQLFNRWFVSLLAVFVVLNLLGLFVHGTKRSAVGFPCVVVEIIAIGEHRESNFHPWSIPINVAVGVGVSGLVALVCAASRAHYNSEKGRREPSHVDN